MISSKHLRQVRKLSSLLDIAKAMIYERDLDRLLELIMREITRVMEADRSSLFLVDTDRGELWTKIAQGLGTQEVRLPMSQGIAGFVASTSKTVNLADAYQHPKFDPHMDETTGYRTKTILCVPLMNRDNSVIGVIQILNKRGGMFTEDDEELLKAFAGQAAAAVETTLLYDEIQRLLEGFIKASVYAIESRDPTTRGHSERVARLTVALAEEISRVRNGPYAGMVFTLEQIREIRYASLLHDFGKIGVRENVLVKANKLYENEMERLRDRFRYIRKTMELACSEHKLECALNLERAEALERMAEMDRELAGRLRELEDCLAFILQANRPAILPQNGFERIQEIANKEYKESDGTLQPYLTPLEAVNLSIAKGSLNEKERREIESHVYHTYRFLRQIPWSRGLRSVPEIAGAHHEKINGQGYPSGSNGDTIPVQSKMMAVCDIYDALTASDRPYKKAVPVPKALDILKMEADSRHLDGNLVEIFIQNRVFQQASPEQTGG